MGAQEEGVARVDRATADDGDGAERRDPAVCPATGRHRDGHRRGRRRRAGSVRHSPEPERWFLAVSAGVGEALDEFLARANPMATPDDADVARLVAAWRLLLRLHERTADGGCRVCGVRTDRRLCTVWQVAVGYFLRRSPPVPSRRRRSGGPVRTDGRVRITPRCD